MNELTISGETPLETDELNKLTSLICSTEDPANDYQISLNVVDSCVMRMYNCRYRGKDESTDVLSFAGEPIVLGSTSNKIERPIRLCDIIIDINQLSQQRGIRTIKDEFRCVFVHGLLHLVGYDHTGQRESTEMRNKEEYYLTQIRGDSPCG